MIKIFLLLCMTLQHMAFADDAKDYLSPESYKLYQQYAKKFQKDYKDFDPHQHAIDTLGEEKYQQITNWAREMQQKVYVTDVDNVDVLDEKGRLNFKALRQAKPIQEASMAANAPQVVIFISNSMPKNSIKAWYKQAQRIGARLALNGFIDNDYETTMEFAQTLFDDEIITFDINPALFDKVGVTQVPTVAIIEEKACVSEPCEIEFDKVEGDVGLRHALNHLKDKGEHFNLLADELLLRFRRGQHG